MTHWNMPAIAGFCIGLTMHIWPHWKPPPFWKHSKKQVQARSA